MEWKITSEIIRYLNSRWKKYILLQTNGTLLDKNKIIFLKDHGVGLEFGIDGDLASMRDHRKGIQRYFLKLIENIHLARHQKLDCFATMTVHPDMASQTFKNFKYLFDLGIKKIEITPAAFERWKNDDIMIFKEDYKKIVSFALTKQRLETMSTEYDSLLTHAVADFIYLPDKSILTNWALLSMPRPLRNKYTMFKTTKEKTELNKNFVSSYFSQYLTFFNDYKDPTYRDFSNLNAKLVYKELFKKKSGMMFRGYLDLGYFLKTINQKVATLKERNLL